MSCYTQTLGGGAAVYTYNQVTISPVQEDVLKHFDWQLFNTLVQRDTASGTYEAVTMALSFLDTIKRQLEVFNFSKMDDKTTQTVVNTITAANQIMDAVAAAYPSVLDWQAMELEIASKDINALKNKLQKLRTYHFVRDKIDEEVFASVAARILGAGVDAQKILEAELNRVSAGGRSDLIEASLDQQATNEATGVQPETQSGTVTANGDKAKSKTGQTLLVAGLGVLAAYLALR